VMRGPSLAMSALIAMLVSALVSLLAGLWWHGLLADLRARVDQIEGQAYLAGVMAVHAASSAAACPAQPCAGLSKVAEEGAR